LFVLALVILVRDWRRVVLTVTAFTVAHSITLAAATLDLVNVPGPPVEAAIRAQHRAGRSRDRECTARDAFPVHALAVARRPSALAFCTASVLPAPWRKWDCHIMLYPSRLLFFNLGVEIGQLAFVAAVLATGELFRRAVALRFEPATVDHTINRLDMVAAYAIGAVAAYWLIERTSAFFV